ncbi:MFS transporter [Mycolicibacterium fortuitum]|uniref:MFS transporter n=1 Tax=Mycolicibacterium fortuitum TaxID=1766 RepID=UPI001CE113EC|nr:MFS transporter [Mycolicibacterium fortuitum]
MTQTQHTPSDEVAPERLPLAGLFGLGTAGFITIMTEALPAGILPAMSADLGVTASAAGQTVTVYALGSALAAVPLTALTIGWPRRRLLLIAVAGFAVANTVTATSSSYVLTMGARFVAGIVAGLLWALLAGYARRMVTPAQRGKAMAIAMAGTPVALSIGVPAGTYLANLAGWRYTFAIITVLTLVLIAWIIAAVPSFPGTTRSDRQPVWRAIRIPGVASVLFVTLTFVLAHNILYTYLAPFLAPLGLAQRIEGLPPVWLTPDL